jgi:archaellum component FlaC
VSCPYYEEKRGLTPSRDHEDHLENVLGEMNQQMEDLKADLAAERSRLQRDNGRLQDLVSEINLKRTAEVESFKSELARLEEETEEEIQAVKDQLISMKLEVEVLTEVS